MTAEIITISCVANVPAPFEVSLLLQLVLQFRSRVVDSFRYVFILYTSRKRRIEFRNIINIVYLSVLLRFPLKERQGAEVEEKESRTRALVTVFCISPDAQISQGNGALISRCRMKIHREPTGGGGEQTRRSVGELQRNWRKKKEKEGGKWEGGEEWEGMRNKSTISRFTRVRACVRAAWESRNFTAVHRVRWKKRRWTNTIAR